MKCNVCKKFCFWAKQRELVHPIIGRMKSQDKMCRKCYKKLLIFKHNERVKTN